MLPRSLRCLFTILLVPCLIIDPSLIAANSSQPILRRHGAKLSSCSSRFEQEAVSVRSVESWHSYSRHARSIVIRWGEALRNPKALLGSQSRLGRSQLAFAATIAASVALAAVSLLHYFGWLPS